MSTLIVEPNPGGHRLQAVANVARVALRSDDVVLLTTPGVRDREEFAAYLADLPLSVDDRLPFVTPTTPDLVAGVAAACRSWSVSHVVVMEGDNALKTWWRVAARPLRGLDTRPTVSFFLTRWPSAGGLRDPYFLAVRTSKIALLLLARVTGTIDRCAGFAGRDVRAPGWPVRNARDPAICEAHSRDRSRLRRELSLPPGRRLAGIFGGINVRKDPALALEAVQAAGPGYDLLLAGPMDEETRSWVSTLPPAARRRVILRDAFWSNQQFDQMLAASDVVVLLMRLEGPSGIMGKALAAGVPVLTAGSRSRARELHALHHGAATGMSVAELARGLKTTVQESVPTAMTGPDLPTAETFGATVLGLPDADPVQSTRRSAAVRFLRRAAHSLLNRGRRGAVGLLLRPRSPEELIRLGSVYGGWWLPASAVRPGAYAYLAGAGEDISFDLALHERGCMVRTFDPTPRSITYVQSLAPADDRFRFIPVGVWDEDRELEFFAPAHEAFVSHSAVNLFDTEVAFRAPVRPMHQLMTELGDPRVDIVKLDIEGAEHQVMADIMVNGPAPAVLCVEFDQPQPLRRIVQRVRGLRRSGYMLVKIEEWNYTFVREGAS